MANNLQMYIGGIETTFLDYFEMELEQHILLQWFYVKTLRNMWIVRVTLENVV